MMRITLITMTALNLSPATNKLLMRFNKVGLFRIFFYHRIKMSVCFCKRVLDYSPTAGGVVENGLSQISSIHQSLVSVISLISGSCGWWTCPPTTPHSVNNPSGSLGPGKSQAQCALAGLQPRGCWATVLSLSRLTSNALIQKTPRQRTADSSDWQRRPTQWS